MEPAPLFRYPPVAHELSFVSAKTHERGASMDVNTLLAGLDFSRTRLLGTLDTIEKSGQDPKKVLSWRPGPGRAHIAWQAMHCAATHDRYLNVGIQQGSPKDADLVANFAGGTTPSDSKVPSLAIIRQ